MDKKGMVLDRSSGRSRRARLGGWVLTQFQVVLALLGMAVCLVLFFGLGFLFGVWYQANEHIRPTDNAIALAEEQLQREQAPTSADKEMTFYQTLTKGDGADTSSAAVVQPEAKTVPVPVPPRAAGSPGQVTTPPAASNNSEVQVPSSQVQAGRSASTSDASPDRALSPSRTQVAVKDTATELVKPEESQPPAVATASVPVQASPPEPIRTAAIPEPPQKSGGAGFTVQVGSFRKASDADRLQQRLSQKGV